ncbi:MAG: hypothetical protein NC311_02805 [Muribaculaceae bacterium]|nr:hypothetical protein [Muribaculaceae bacterium]
MKNKILVAIGFVVCFAVGFVCGMYAQSRIVAGNDEDSGVFVFVQKNLFVANKNNNNHDDLSCPDGTTPDGNGCCGDEVYTDLGENGFNCCPPGNGDCFPPIM